MRKSARILGQECGLSAQEMNHLLKNQGYLDGETGGYYPTEDGKKYASEEYHRRGTGGYAQYNPQWDTRTWDDTILGVLDLSAGMLSQVRREVAEERELEKAAKDTAIAATAAAINVLSDSDNEDENLDLRNLGKVGKIMIIIAGIAGAIYGGYKAAPHVKRFWTERAKPRLTRHKSKVIKKTK